VLLAREGGPAFADVAKHPALPDRGLWLEGGCTCAEHEDRFVVQVGDWTPDWLPDVDFEAPAHAAYVGHYANLGVTNASGPRADPFYVAATGHDTYRTPGQ